MIFFNCNASTILESAAHNKETLAASGYYEIILPAYNKSLYRINLNADTLVFNKEISKYVFIGPTIKVNDYDSVRLKYTIEENTKLFNSAFSQIETRAQRPYSALLSALISGDDLPEPDSDIIWQFEAVKEENRTLLAQLNAATTWEEAEAIKPWMPWDAPTRSWNPHRPAEQNLYESDNARLLS